MTGEKATTNSLSQHVAVDKLPVSADQTRSTRDILHLIQSRANSDISVPASSDTPCSTNTETLTNGLRQFQVRPQLFEAIMMQPASTVISNCDAENNSVSAPTKQSPAGLFLSCKLLLL